MMADFPREYEQILFGMGCFWGAEKIFWERSGVYVTAVGYTAGNIKNPTYQQVCSGETGHVEVVLVVFNPSVVQLNEILKLFWDSHDPTQGMRQGNDSGSQYRSALYYSNRKQQQCATQLKNEYQKALLESGFSVITTEIEACQIFYYAETYHQQYLAKNPNGYCGLGGTGVQWKPSCRC